MTLRRRRTRRAGTGRPRPTPRGGKTPCSPYIPKDRVDEYAGQSGPHSVQRVLDSALAWYVINNHLDVADFLLKHGAEINTRWSSHEPASILHEVVFQANYEAMQFLIDRGERESRRSRVMRRLFTTILRSALKAVRTRGPRIADHDCYRSLDP